MLIRNYKKYSKYDPIFLPEPFRIVSVIDEGRRLELERLYDGKLFSRHPDDVKKVDISYREDEHQGGVVEKNRDIEWRDIFHDEEEHNDNTILGLPLQQHIHQQNIHLPHVPLEQPVPEPQEHNPDPAIVRRSHRQRQQPDRYGLTAYNENQPLLGENDTVAPWWPGWRQGQWHPPAPL